MSAEGTVKWIEEGLVPRLLEAAKAHLPGGELRSKQVRGMDSMKDNWASAMYLLDLTFDVDGGEKEVSVIVKVMHEDARLRDKMQSPKQFFNEIHFYSTIVPFLTSQVPSEKLRTDFLNLFPKCYLSYFAKDKYPEESKDAYLVMENLKVLDYRLGDRLYLDFKHFSLALQCLGEFHAYSYFMKERDFNSFLNTVVKPIQETNYDPKDQETWNRVFGLSEQRVIHGMSREALDDDAKLGRLQELSRTPPFAKFEALTSAREPLAVLCHGDFLRNNVLFRYDGEGEGGEGGGGGGGVLAQMKMLDFQTVRYASPALDVALLLCMNSTRELRAGHLEELLRVYHASLRRALAALQGVAEAALDPARFSFAAFMAEFRARALYGYLISIEFVPWMFAEAAELQAFVKVYLEARGSDQHLALARTLGGERATRALVDLAKDLIAHDCLMLPASPSAHPDAC